MTKIGFAPDTQLTVGRYIYSTAFAGLFIFFFFFFFFFVSTDQYCLMAWKEAVVKLVQMSRDEGFKSCENFLLRA
jgi:hypothetical protein